MYVSRLGQVDMGQNRREWVEWEEEEYGYHYPDGYEGLECGHAGWPAGEEYLW